MRADENRKHQKIRQRSERVTPHPNIPMPVCFLYPAIVGKHTESKKGTEPQGMTIVNSEQCPYSGLSPSFSPSAPPCPGKPVISLVCVRRERCPGPVAVSLVTDGAAVLLIDIPPGYVGGLGP